MTGYYVRFPFDGQVANVELDELGDEQLAAWARTLDESRARAWAVALARWIRDNVGTTPPPRIGDVAEQVPAFTCPQCGRTSFNPNDATGRYCGACHRFF